MQPQLIDTVYRSLRHFNLIQWVGVLIVVSYLFFLYSLFFGDRAWDWQAWVLLIGHGLATITCLVMIEYPGPDGFADRDHQSDQ